MKFTIRLQVSGFLGRCQKLLPSSAKRCQKNHRNQEETRDPSTPVMEMLSINLQCDSYHSSSASDFSKQNYSPRPIFSTAQDKSTQQVRDIATSPRHFFSERSIWSDGRHAIFFSTGTMRLGEGPVT